MDIIDLHTILDAESCIVTGESRFRGDIGENGKEELIWEFEYYERAEISQRSIERSNVRSLTGAGFGCGRG